MNPVGYQRRRLSDHKYRAASSKSTVREHVERSGGYEIDWTGVKVLERESKELSRRVLEAIQIKTKGLNLNKDKGWIQILSTILCSKRGAGLNDELKFSLRHMSSFGVIINFEIKAKHQLTTDTAHPKVLLRYVNFCGVEV